MTNTALYEQLRYSLNAHSAENASNTPDFVLAHYLIMALDAFDAAVQARNEWYGAAPRMVADETTDPPTFTPLEPDLQAAELREQLNFWRGIAEDRKLIAEGYRDAAEAFKEKAIQERERFQDYLEGQKLQVDALEKIDELLTPPVPE